jgi:hypothetical protein
MSILNSILEDSSLVLGFAASSHVLSKAMHRVPRGVYALFFRSTGS